MPVCDTMVAMSNVSRDGKVYFAKNSDRQPNEPHIMVHIPRKQYPAGAKLKCTYIEIEQVKQTYEVLLLKPSWIWGCEMGCNEFGLNIGNEAVFTREKYGDPRLTGMDMIRLALERCQNSEEALKYLVELLERYGQGGNCGFEKPFTYHNSFLIADHNEAWVLETAGEYWAAQKVTDLRTISNGLSIGRSFDSCHERLVEHAIQKRWCKSEQDFDFARAYKDRLVTHFSGSEQRRNCCEEELKRQHGKIDAMTMISVLRSHQADIEGQQFQRPSLQSVCMHAGGLIGDHTTGSYVAALGSEGSSYWVTGASTPCLAAFKPLWLVPNNPVLFGEDQEKDAIAYWLKREELHRMVVNGQIPNLNEYLGNRDHLETEWFQTVEEIETAKASDQEKIAFMKKAWQDEAEMIDRFIRENRSRPSRNGGGLYFRYYWHRQNSNLKKGFSD